MYSPILRNRQSEILALKHLSQETCEKIMPIIDIAAPSKSSDRAKGQQYVERNINRTERVTEHFSSVFVDSSELDPAFQLPVGIHPLTAAAEAIVKGGSQPIPITGLHRDATHNSAVLAIRKKHALKSIGIRLDITDVSTATITFRGIKSFLTKNTLSPSQVFIILDLECLYEQDTAPVIKQVIRLTNLLKHEAWAGIIVGGYAIPDQLSTAVSTNDQSYLKRIEQEIYYSIVKHEQDLHIWFGDYTTLPPSFVELDWKLIRKVMTPKALYTLEDSWFIVRGNAFASHPDGYDQYFSIAQEIVALDEYCGEEYCYGDQYIWERSERTGSAGSPASWITACVNHHITLTAETHSA